MTRIRGEQSGVRRIHSYQTEHPGHRKDAIGKVVELHGRVRASVRLQGAQASVILELDALLLLMLLLLWTRLECAYVVKRASHESKIVFFLRIAIVVTP